MEQLIKDNWKRYLISSVVTFLAGFCIAVIPMLDSFSIHDLTTSTVVGILAVGMRAGIKVLMETFLAWYSTKHS